MRVVIIGGSHAGIACASRAREEYPDAEIVIYEKQTSIGFVAQSIPLFLRDDPNFETLASYVDVDGLARHGIKVKTGCVVRDVDTAAKQLDVMTADGLVRTEPYDKLVLATGSYPSIPLAAGQYEDLLFVVKNYEHAVKIREFMDYGETVIVIGGGAIGIEMCRVMLEHGLRTTLVQSHVSILDRYVDEELAQLGREALEESGVVVHTQTLITGIRETTIEGRRQIVVTSQDGRTFAADGVVYATGFRPNSFLLRNQAELGDKGAIVVDEYMQTSVPDVFAVGDCATTKLTHVAVPRYIPHASDALRQGEIAAINLAGPRQKLNPSQGTYNLNIGERTLCMTGLTVRQAREEGLDADVAFFKNDYIEGERHYRIWLVYEKGTHKILGMQLRGTAPELSPYADIISLAIERDMAIEELEFADFYFKHGYRNPNNFTKILADIVRVQDPRQAG